LLCKYQEEINFLFGKHEKQDLKFGKGVIFRQELTYWSITDYNGSKLDIDVNEYLHRFKLVVLDFNCQKLSQFQINYASSDKKSRQISQVKTASYSHTVDGKLIFELCDKHKIEIDCPFEIPPGSQDAAKYFGSPVANPSVSFNGHSLV
jgi:hypothetical protein